MEGGRGGSVGQPYRGGGEHPAVQPDPPDPQLGERHPQDGRDQRVERREQDDDRELPHREDVLADPGILARAPGQLDGGHEAQQQRTEGDQAAGIDLSRIPRSQADRGDVDHDDRHDEPDQPAGNLPQRPGPDRLDTDAHTFAYVGSHASLLWV